eukprot:4350210-Amphidinium_carterae.1
MRCNKAVICALFKAESTCVVAQARRARRNLSSPVAIGAAAQHPEMRKADEELDADCERELTTRCPALS